MPTPSGLIAPSQVWSPYSGTEVVKKYLFSCSGNAKITEHRAEFSCVVIADGFAMHLMASANSTRGPGQNTRVTCTSERSPKLRSVKQSVYEQ